ncbi:MAG: hypothetical protein RIT45_3845 [Pseudomonadota bacterium]|jgi:hypothetical protein
MLDWLQGPPDPGGLSDDVLRDRHVALQRHIRIVRVAIPLAVFCIIAGTMLHIRSTFSAIAPDAMGVAFEKQATRVLPKLQRAAVDVGEEVAPIVGEAFVTQLDGAFDRLSGRLDSEMKLLGDSLPGTLEKQLHRKLEEANAASAEALYQSFPELKQDPARVQRLLTAFQNGFSAWAAKTLNTTFAGHLKELDAIKGTLNGFVLQQHQAEQARIAADAEAGKHRAKTKITPEQLLALWLEILDEALKSGGDSDLFTAPAEAPAGR